MYLRHKSISIAAILLAAFFTIVLWGGLFASQESSAEAESLCTSAAVPEDECNALVALYRQSNGGAWTRSDGWLTQTATLPCDWYGVVCSGGRVTSLSLNDNGLKGEILGTICPLTRVATSADFSYNSISSPRIKARDCLDALDPDWRATQTVAPQNLRVTRTVTEGVELAWDPIEYQSDGGYYEVRYRLGKSGPFTLHGKTASKTASTYIVDGLESGRAYQIQVRTTTPAHANQTLEVSSQPETVEAVTRSPIQMLVAIYFQADNDLSAYIPDVIRRLQKGSQVNPNVGVVLFVDGNELDDTRVITVREGKVSLTDAVENRWGKKELDSSDPAVMGWFLTYARTNYPADRTFVSILGHGTPLVTELAWIDDALPSVGSADVVNPAAKRRRGLPPLPQGEFDTLSDQTDGGYLSVQGLGEALRQATSNWTIPFDVIFLDKCFYGNLESLYQIHRAADVFVSSANYAWFAVPYGQYIGQLSPVATNTEIAAGIIKTYQEALNNDHPNVIFGLKGDQIPVIANATSSLGSALTEALQKGGQEAVTTIEAAALSSQYVDTDQCDQPQFVLGQPDALLGLNSFATNLSRTTWSDEDHGVPGAAQAVLDAMVPIFASARIGRPYFAPDSIWAYDDTLTVMAPLDRNEPPSSVWRSSLYGVADGTEARWTLVPTQTLIVSGTLAFTDDTHWDEFLNTWYQTELTPTVGSWCHYTPPAQVQLEDTEMLSLTIEPGNDGVRSRLLSWSATSDERAQDYWLFVWGPNDLSWTVERVLPLSQTSLDWVADVPGSYRFGLLARDANGLFVAEAPPVRDDIRRNQILHLPYVSH